LNEELNVMRSSLSLGLWNNILHNYRYGIEHGGLFEMGQTFYQEGPEMKETLRMSLAAWGNSEDLWSKTGQQVNPVYKIKSFIEELANAWKLPSLRVCGASDQKVPEFLHRGQWAVVEFRNQPIGWVGTLHPQKLADVKIRVPVAMMEIELESLIEAQSSVKKITTPVKHQAVTRDLALVMPKDLAVGDLLKTVQHKAGPALISYKVLDIFVGEPIDSDKKSVSIRLVWQDPAQSLQEEAVNLLQTQLLENLTKQFPVALR
jgi:phenylalanyl-tRNA synthetase beta chain